MKRAIVPSTTRYVSGLTGSNGRFASGLLLLRRRQLSVGKGGKLNWWWWNHRNGVEYGRRYSTSDASSSHAATTVADENDVIPSETEEAQRQRVESKEATEAGSEYKNPEVAEAFLELLKNRETGMAYTVLQQAVDEGLLRDSGLYEFTGDLFKMVLADAQRGKTEGGPDPVELFHFLRENRSSTWLMWSRTMWYLIQTNRAADALELWPLFMQERAGRGENAMKKFDDLIQDMLVVPTLFSLVTVMNESGTSVEASEAAKLIEPYKFPSGGQVRKAVARSGFNDVLKIEDQVRVLGIKYVGITSDEYLTQIREEINQSLNSDNRSLRLTKCFEDVKRSGQVMDERLYVAFLGGFNRLGDFNSVYDIWNDMMRQDKFKPSRACWNILLKATAALNRRTNSGAIQVVWDQMVEAGVKPDSISYTTLIEAQFSSGKPQEAIETFKGLMENPQSKVMPTLRMFNVLLKGLISNNKVGETERLMHDGQESGFNPDVVTYNTLLGAYVRKKQFEKANTVLGEMDNTGVSPDVVTYTTVLDSMFKSRALSNELPSMEQVEIVLQDMQEHGIEANQVTYAALIDGLSQVSTTCEPSRMVYQSMLDKGVRPTSSVFTSLMKGEIRHGSTDRGVEYMHEMRVHHVAMTIPIWTMLINGYIREGRLPEAMALYGKMKKTKEKQRGMMRIDSRLVHILLNGCLQGNQFEWAGNVLEDMANGHFEIRSKQTIFIVEQLAKYKTKIPALYSHLVAHQQSDAVDEENEIPMDAIFVQESGAENIR